MARPATNSPFLVAGGGIGGLTVAYSLAREGFPVRVLEESADFRESGAGLQLGPNVFGALVKLGLKDEVLVDAWQPGKLEIHDAVTGDTIAALPLGARFLDRFRHPLAVIHRADLHGALLHACRTQSLISLELDSRVADFSETDDGVALRLDSGEEVRGCALIGCDGLWSRVRANLVGDGAPRVSGHIAYRAVLKREAVPEDLWRPGVVFWAGPHTTFVHYPLRRGTLYNLLAVFRSTRLGEGWDTRGDTNELWRHFQGQRPEVTRLLERAETWRMWVLCDREPVRDWSRGRVTLLGDAAHPMLIYLAQGAGMAIEDAVTLAEKVAATPEDLAGAFQAYQNARYLRTGRVQLTARAWGELCHARGVAAELRNQKLRGLPPEQAFDDMAWLFAGA